MVWLALIVITINNEMHHFSEQARTYADYYLKPRLHAELVSDAHEENGSPDPSSEEPSLSNNKLSSPESGLWILGLCHEHNI